MTKKNTLLILSLLWSFIMQAQDWKELGKDLPTHKPANNAYDFGELVVVDGNHALVDIADAISGYGSQQKRKKY